MLKVRTLKFFFLILSLFSNVTFLAINSISLKMLKQILQARYFQSDVVACTCNSATEEAEFWNGVGSIPLGGNSPLIGGWIM